MTPGEISALFERRGIAQTVPPLMHPEESTEMKLVPEGMQCPHTGFSQSEPGILCCLVYSEYLSGGVASFFNGTCRQFLCPAWDELTDREVLFAAELTGDWYYYSLLINSIELIKDICADYTSPGDVPEERLMELKKELITNLREEDII